MTCPKCGAPLKTGYRFCTACGSAVSTKKRSHFWPPFLCLLVMLIIGSLLFILIRPEAHSDSLSETLPKPKSAPFRMDGSILYFEPDAYTGDGQLIIPDTIDGQMILALGDGCFADCTNLTSVILPNHLLYVGNDAFSGCTNLRGIYVSADCITIGDSAFSDCESLEAICLSDKLTEIGKDAFDGTDKLKFIFYTGDHNAWFELHPKYISAETGIYCNDGIYFYKNPN